jgi:hypothetical protein
MPLTDVTVKNAKASKKSVKLFDGRGLYLEVSPSQRQMVEVEVSIRGQRETSVFGRLS